MSNDASNAPPPDAPAAGAPPDAEGAGGEYAALAAQCAALDAALRAGGAGAPPSEAERARLRGEIVALIRAAAARARAYAALEDAAKALPALWKALPAAPAAEPPRRTTRADHLGASTYAAKGWSAYAVGDYAASEAAYAQALALAPDDAEAAALHAWALAALGRDDEARRAAQAVLAARPPEAAAALARVALGRVCLRQGATGEGLEHLTRAARDDVDRRATLYATFHLGVASGEQGQHGEAVAFLRRALALGPNLVEAHYELGRAHWRAGASDAALAAWRAGATAGKFSPWAARCEALRLRMSEGGELPAE